MNLIQQYLEILRRSATKASAPIAVSVLLSLGGCFVSNSFPEPVDEDGDGFLAIDDCDDNDENVYPGAPICTGDADNIDYDCDGEIDICVSVNPVPDADGDGYDLDEDCDDNNAAIYPGAEIPECPFEPADYDCDGVAEACIANPLPDRDGDGYDESEDCDDEDPQIHPGATDPTCPDGIDQDCNGIDGEPFAAVVCDTDQDGDGYPVDEDCNDRDATIYPGAEEDVCPDGLDQDCDGEDGAVTPLTNCFSDDLDGDGFGLYGEPADCDDTRAWVHPEATEDCYDGMDNDCDGIIDEEPEEGCFIGNGMLDADSLEEPSPADAPVLMSVNPNTSHA